MAEHSPFQLRPASAGLVLALALLVGLLLTGPGQVALKMVLLLPELFPDPPARPLLAVTGAPRFEEYRYDSPLGGVESDLYLPATGGHHGAVILYTGVFGLRREPAFVRLAEALARSGAVVLVPESAALRAGDVLPGEADELIAAMAYLRQRADVDPDRVGLFGLSVGGSVALLAAEQAVGPEQPAFVSVFGAYYDARQLAREVLSHQIEVDGSIRSWEPSEVANYTAIRQIIGALPDFHDCDILWRVFIDQQTEARAELGQLSPGGCAARDLFERPSSTQADQLIAALPASSRERLAAISPSTSIAQLKTPLYVMHDRTDSYIPYTQARRLAAEAPPGTLRTYAEFDLFSHVTPDRHLPPLQVAGELLKLAHYAWLVGQEFL